MATDDDDIRKEGRKERMRMQAKDIMHANSNSQRHAGQIRGKSPSRPQLQPSPLNGCGCDGREGRREGGRETSPK